MFEKIRKKLEEYPAYVKTRDKVAECILAAFMAFFNTVGPVWNFFFLKTPYSDETSETGDR